MGAYEKSETILRVTRVPDATRGRVTFVEGEARVVLEYENGNEERAVALSSDDMKILGPILDGLRKRALSDLGFEAKEALTAEAEVLSLRG
jgi:hypothetical protein